MKKLTKIYLSINILSIIILIASILLTTFLLHENVFWKILIVLYSFSLLPAYTYALIWEYNHLNNKSTEQSFKEGFSIGYFFGFTYLLLPLFFAPIFLVLYIYSFIDYIKLNRKSNKF